jgi:exodeoxyribonuclease VII large subunit
MNEQRVYSVTELNRAARGLLETELGEVWMKGEVVDASLAPSGHLYFSLKDSEAQIDVVRFRGRSPVLVTLEPGMVVLVFGRTTVYEPRGRYQFVASLVQPVGAGLLHAAFERLKERLREEGLFDIEHKRPLCAFPTLVGVVTSPTGAALHDILAVLGRRWPLARVVLFPSSVQGAAAPAELVAALERAGRFTIDGAPLDFVILGRGGGAAEDLAAFNDERVARAVYASPIPIVSAVGHDVDVSITDFVADLRAATPSAAAELTTPDRTEIAESVRRAAQRLHDAIDSRWAMAERALRSTLRASLVREPRRLIETREQKLDLYVGRLLRFPRLSLDPQIDRLRHAEEVLRLCDPRRPLERGYSITYVAGAKTPLRRAADAAPGLAIETVLAKGRITSRVEGVEEE